MMYHVPIARLFLLCAIAHTRALNIVKEVVRLSEAMSASHFDSWLTKAKTIINAYVLDQPEAIVNSKIGQRLYDFSDLQSVG